jgi:hypothetical protein
VGFTLVRLQCYLSSNYYRELKAIRLKLTLLVLNLMLAGPTLVRAECSDAQKLQLFEKGWTKSQVHQFCAAGDSSAAPADNKSNYSSGSSPSGAYSYLPPPPPPPAYADTVHLCVTNYVTCRMMVVAIPGGPCTCYMPYGTYFGVVR